MEIDQESKLDELSIQYKVILPKKTIDKVLEKEISELDCEKKVLLERYLRVVAHKIQAKDDLKDFVQ